MSSRTDHIFLKKLSETVKIPLVVYSGEDNIFQYPERDRFESYFDTVPAAVGMLRDTLLAAEGKPILFIEDSTFYFGALHAGDNVIVLGPVSLEKPGLEAMQAFRNKHRLERLPLIAKSSPYRLSAALSLIAYHTGGLDIDPDQIQIVNALPDMSGSELVASAAYYALEQSEMDRDHDSADYEYKMMEIVESGDIEAMEKLMYSSQQLEKEHIGQLAPDEIKHTEYMMITLITLLSRAAVRGGASMEDSYSLADIFMQKISRCRTAPEMMKLGTRATYEFTLEARKAREKKQSPNRCDYIESCKSYIAANLRKPFRVGDIAPAIGVNRSYLARRFSESEGMTIQQYVLRERCEQAAKLLVHSDYPISLIAEYFCFSSQSHFGRAFREYSGMTPKEYRNRNKQF